MTGEAFGELKNSFYEYEHNIMHLSFGNSNAMSDYVFQKDWERRQAEPLELTTPKPALPIGFHKIPPRGTNEKNLDGKSQAPPRQEEFKFTL